MPDNVTDAELAVLQMLWDSPGATIRQLTDKLYPPGRPSQYATVQKLLERLEGKKFVQRDRSTSVHTFTATCARDDLIGQRLRTLAEQLCEGSLTPLLSNLVRNTPLSRQDRQALRSLVERLDQTRPGNPNS